MKVLCMGDLHLRFSSPANRIDNFFETQKDKVRQVLEIAKRERVSFIVQPGDFFDSPRPSFYLLSEYIKLFREYDIPIYCIVGQHDLYMANYEGIKRTPIKVLESAGVVKYVEDMEVVGNILIYGASYSKEIKRPVKKDGQKAILLTHKMVSDRPLYPGQEFISLRKFFEDTPGYDLRVLGDNHYWFHYQSGNSHLLNCGCLVRKTIADINLQPQVCVWDSESSYVEWFVLNYKPYNEVFNMEMVERTKEKDNTIISFINELNMNYNKSISFQDNIVAFLDKNNVEEEVRNVIYEVLNLKDRREEK